MNHANSILSIIPVYIDVGIESRYFNEILKEMCNIYGRLLRQDNFKCHTLFTAGFYKIDEEDQKSNEIEIFLNLNTNQILTESDIKNIDNKSKLEHEMEIQPAKNIVWIFDKIN